MSKLSLVFLVLLAFLQCRKNNKADPEPLPEIASIVGKWRIVAQIQTVGDSLITNPVAEENASLYVFRFDGILVNEKGNMFCCLPQNYFLNGNLFESKPLVPVEYDPGCKYVDCAGCPEMTIIQSTSDSLLIETCKGSYTSLVRQK